MVAPAAEPINRQLTSSQCDSSSGLSFHFDVAERSFHMPAGEPVLGSNA